LRPRKDLANFYKRLYAEGVVPEQSLAGYTNIEPFGLGQVAMQVCGSWGVAQIINEFPEVANLFAVAPVPTQDGNQDKPTATNGGWTYAIDANTKHEKAIADFIFWLLGDDPAIPAGFFAVAQYSKSAPRKSVDEYIAAHSSGQADWAEPIAYVVSRAIPEPVYP
jgi:multiple sugar transport system substrate-binding protein